MFEGLRRLALKGTTLVLVLGIAIGSVALSRPSPAEAHCDSITGPVVTAAKQALESGNVNLVLPYVQPAAEKELTEAFQNTLEVRKLGGDAQALADRYFYETAVRLHRAGEGAAYTGLKEESDFGPALAAADKALETGAVDGVYTVLDEAMREGVAEKYQAVLDAREHESKEGTVEAARERAEAELIFEKYVYELHTAAQGAGEHAEGGQADTGHQHGAGTAESGHEADGSAVPASGHESHDSTTSGVWSDVGTGRAHAAETQLAQSR